MSKRGRKSAEPTSVLTKFVSVVPKTDNQKQAFYEEQGNGHMMLTGFPGTGKTLLAMNFALQTLIRDNNYKKICIVRSVVPTRDMGHLPGTSKEKAQIFEEPYYSICRTLFPDVESPYAALKLERLVEFMSTSHVRGITLSDCVVVLDEVQNCNAHEIFSIITRLGNNTRLFICGDSQQTDLVRETSGFHHLMRTAQIMKEFSVIEFTVDDIVRSDFIKAFIKAWDKCQTTNKNTSGGKPASSKRPNQIDPS